MKRLYVIVFLVIAATAALGFAVAQHSGYVLIAYKSFRYEASLWATLAVIAVLWLLIWGIKALVELVMTSSGVVNPWSRRNRSRRVQVAIEHGQLDLAEGRWASAQRHLYRAAEAERQPLLYYLGAARAANEQGNYEECDRLLERALERQPQAELAIALSHAQLQTDRGDTDGALVTLQAMHDRHPHNAQTLRQLQRLYQQRGEWSAVIRLLPELRKDKVLPRPNWLNLSAVPGVKTSRWQRSARRTAALACSRSRVPGSSSPRRSVRSHRWYWHTPNSCASWALRSKRKKCCAPPSSASTTAIWPVSTVWCAAVIRPVSCKLPKAG